MRGRLAFVTVVQYGVDAGVDLVPLVWPVPPTWCKTTHPDKATGEPTTHVPEWATDNLDRLTTAHRPAHTHDCSFDSINR